MASVQFLLDGANLDAALTAAPFAITWDSTTVADGSHTLTALATDASGNQATAAPVNILVSNTVSSLGLPTVAVVANPATAVIGTANDAVLTFVRTGDTTQPLTVNFALGGTAAQGTDYHTTSGDMPVSVTIPAGYSQANLTIVGVSNSTGANPETATFTLTPSAAYTIGSPDSATITIVKQAVRKRKH